MPPQSKKGFAMHWYRHTGVALGVVLALSTGSQAQTRTLPPAAQLAEATQPLQDRDLAVFDELWRTVHERFYDPALHGRDWKALREQYRPLVGVATSDEERSAVINRMLAELGASHTRHYTRADPAYYQLLDIFSGALRHELRRVFADGSVVYPGIGVFTRQIDGKTFVSGVLDGLPARQAGLLVGDELLTVEGAPYHAVQSFTDKAGQMVTLQVRRERHGQVHDMAGTPESIAPNEAFLKAMAASARLIHADGAKIGYIHVWSYASAQYQRLLERELFSGALKDAEALVLDLRDGWGGAQAHYLDLFNNRAPTVTLVERHGEAAVVNDKWRKPVVLLVNQGTRSGKEIFTYGFKKYGLGEVIGTPTAGAVLAGRASLLSDGSLLLVAVSDVRVDGVRLEGTGVSPTIHVPFPLEYAQGKDPQLEQAVALLARSVRG
jgi:carboxyl-terminal processing protease